MLFYFPLESYKARYTCQLSAKGVGWLESRWIENNIPYTRVEPNIETHDSISSGSVLDACQRGIYSCHQVAEFLKMLQNGQVTSNDVLYFDDFWTPGLEALPYAFNLTGINPRIYGLLHAQSVDINDFTYKMLPWIRHIEKGYGACFDGIFVSCDALQDAVLRGGIGSPGNVFKTGLPFNSDRVRDYFPNKWRYIEKKEQIVFSSRWDTEKDPLFFLKVAQNFADFEPHFKFVITTSHEKLQSNDQKLLEALNQYLKRNSNLEVRENQTKEQYYTTLLESKFQFNCAHQDYISWTLLEAITCSCIPIYPNYLSFPEFLSEEYMYDKGDPGDAVNTILSFELESHDPYLFSVVEKQNETWRRMAQIMGVI